MVTQASIHNPHFCFAVHVGACSHARRMNVIVGSEALARGLLTRGQLRWNYRAIFPGVYVALGRRPPRRSCPRNGYHEAEFDVPRGSLFRGTWQQARTIDDRPDGPPGLARGQGDQRGPTSRHHQSGVECSRPARVCSVPARQKPGLRRSLNRSREFCFAAYSGSRAAGHDIHRGPPRPVPSSEAAIVSTSMPASCRRALVRALRS